MAQIREGKENGEDVGSLFSLFTHTFAVTHVARRHKSRDILTNTRLSHCHTDHGARPGGPSRPLRMMRILHFRDEPA